MNATICLGPAVDRYLDGSGALAQAVDRRTILVSSKVLGFGAAEQRILLYHELAHLKQLARPGNDPIEWLEAEAWEAAAHWMQGRPYVVRGRANRPLNAVAIIQGGEKGHPHAPLWYAASPSEPMGNGSSLTVDESAVHEHITLESIFDQILASKKTTDVIVVSHGSGAGLAIPLRDGATAGAEKDVIVSLGTDKAGADLDVGGTKVKMPAISDKRVSELTRLTESQVQSLRAKMNQVRAMKLKHLGFRACNMGISKETMQAFQALFGSASVSAPTQFDSYGTFSPSIGPDLEGWAKSLRNKQYQIAVDDNVGFGTRNTDSPLKYTIVSRATSKDAFGAWVRKHIAERAWGSNGVIYHGVKVLHPAGPTAASVWFVRDKAFIDNLVFIG